MDKIYFSGEIKRGDQPWFDEDYSSLIRAISSDFKFIPSLIADQHMLSDRGVFIKRNTNEQEKNNELYTNVQIILTGREDRVKTLETAIDEFVANYTPPEVPQKVIGPY